MRASMSVEHFSCDAVNILTLLYICVIINMQMHL